MPPATAAAASPGRSSSANPQYICGLPTLADRVIAYLHSPDTITRCCRDCIEGSSPFRQRARLARNLSRLQAFFIAVFACEGIGEDTAPLVWDWLHCLSHCLHAPRETDCVGRIFWAHYQVFTSHRASHLCHTFQLFIMFLQLARSWTRVSVVDSIGIVLSCDYRVL